MAQNGYEFDVTINAESEAEAEKKIQLLLELADAVKTDELDGIVEFIIEYPNTVQLIKDELPEMKDKSTLQLVSRAAKLIGKIKDALGKDGYEIAE